MSEHRSERAERTRQLAYSDLESRMLDEGRRRKKAAKVIAVLGHFLGRQDFVGLQALDIGCSTGFFSSSLSRAGASVTAFDIDVPGLARASTRFGDEARFVCADGQDMPLQDRSMDIVIFNQIYEHVVDPDAVMSEIRRVLKPDGVVYLGLGNRYCLVEPHYRLPLLSWLPRRLANRYVAMTGRADSYYEQFRTLRDLRRMCAGLNAWDYTYTVLAESQRFAADDMVPKRLRNAPPLLWHAATPVIPTFLWVGTLGRRDPAGTACRVAPTPVPIAR